jgi:kinetochore-associated protein 1
LQPLITSTAVSSGTIALSLFNEIFIFDGEHLNFVSTVSFESNVDTMAWCPDSQFLVICDSSGTMHFFSFALGDVVFTSTLAEVPKEKLSSDPHFSHSMFSINPERGGINLTILSHDGCLYSFKDLPLRELSTALESRDFASIGKLKENIQREIIAVSDVHQTPSCCIESVVALRPSLVVSGTGDVALSLWADQNLVDVIETAFLEGAGVTKCVVSLDGKYMLILDEQSSLSVWDTNALIMLSVPCDRVKDFVLTSGAATVQEAGTQVSDAGQVVTLTESDDGKSKIKIYQLPHFQEIYTKEVAESCRLAKSNLQEKVFYTEEYVNTASNNNVQGLAFKCLSESSPEHRVYSLVRKKRYDAALEFSRAFGLDVEFVYKAKASTIVADISARISESDISGEDKVSSVDQIIDNLEETLQNIRSVEFTVECCLSASPPQLQQVHRILSFAKDKIGNVSAKEKNKYSKELSDVLSLLQRLDTFQMVFGDAQFNGQKWRLFSSETMLSKVTQALSEGKMSSAAVIWLRHHTEFENEFSRKHLQEILTSVRSDLPSSSIVSWMKSYLVPFLVRSVNDQNLFYDLASWLEQRVISLEIAEKEDWPNNGLDMATLLFDVVAECDDENGNYVNIPTPVIVSQEYGSGLVKVLVKDSLSNPVSSLALLVEHLTELKKLHINYHCKLPLAEFTKETPIGIMFKMLDCVLAVTLIPNVINNQVTQYGVQHGFQIDDVLLKYLSYKTKQVYSNVSNTLHEGRFVEITRCIKTRSKRLQAILLLMSWASVPWSSTIEEMVSKAMQDNPSNPSLQNSYRLMEIKKIFSHYGIRDMEFSSDLHLKNVVKYMLSTSHKTVLKDALRIVETYHCMSEEDVYVIRLRNLSLKGLPQECVQLLADVDDSKVVSVAQYFLTWVSLVVDDYGDDEDDRKERNLVMEAGVHTLEFLQNIGKITDDMKVTLNTLKCILALEKDFSIFITHHDYNNMDVRNEILSAHLKKCNIPLQRLIEVDDGSEQGMDKLSRLGNLFGLSSVQLQNKIIFQRIFDHPSCPDSSTMMICNEWLKENIHELSSGDVFALSMALLQQQVSNGKNVPSTDFNVPEMLYRLACRAATDGGAVNLVEYMNLSKICWLSEMLYFSCESGDLSLSTSVCEEDLLLLWNNASRFRDNGFVLDIKTAFPLYNRFVKSLLLVSESTVEQLSIACQDLVFYLEENNLHELALHYALCSLHHLLVLTSNAAPCPENDSIEQNHRMEILVGMSVYGANHVSSMLLNLASKVLDSSDIDHMLAVGYLSSVPDDTALQKLKSDFAVDEGHDASQSIAAFKVLLSFAKQFCNAEIVDAVDKLHTDALWHARLQKLNIPCENLLIGDVQKMKKILEILLEKPGIDVKVVVEFCKSFGINIGETLRTYIKFNLAGNRTSSGDPTVLADSFDTSRSIDNFRENLVQALEYMSNHLPTLELSAFMKDVLLSLPMYDYKRLLIVLDEIIKLSSSEDQEVFRKQREVLNILANYSRIASPSEYEKHFQVDKSSFGVKERLGPSKHLAEKRLPFHPLFYGKPWKIIAPELNDETITKLLRLCQILKMQEDQVYVAAAMNLISSRLSEKPVEGSTPSDPVASIYFEKATQLLSSVENFQLAVKTGSTLLKSWPQCEERVKAAYALVDLVLQWKSTCQGDELQKAEGILKTSNALCQEIVIQHILHSNGVTDEGSFNYKRMPVKLIFHLYETYGCVPHGKRPSVHKIADEIATAFDLNITKVRRKFLSERQPSSSSRGMRSADNCTAEKRAKDLDDVKRIVYVMQADSVQKNNALFFLNFAYRQGQSKITYESRVGAMKLLFNIASHELIESVANDSIDGLKNYMKSLVYLSELEHLHLNQTVESFQRCNKEGLVKGLWKNHKDNTRAILLIADICLDSKISDPQIWTNILRQLSNLGLTTYLSHLLPRLTQFPSLWQSSNLLKIWRDLIIQSLQKAVYPLSSEERISCQTSMQLLQKCPVMTKEVISLVFEKLLELGMHSYALACLSLLPRKMLSGKLTKMMSSTTPEKILDLLSEERDLGQCFVNPDVAQTLVFDFLDASGSYESLESSKHHLKFADYLIEKKKLTVMVMTMIRRGDLDAAIKLAQHYSKHGTPLKMNSSLIHVNPSIPGLDDLVAFLNKFGKLEEAVPYLPNFETSVVSDERPQLDSGSTITLDDADFNDVF